MFNETKYFFWKDRIDKPLANQEKKKREGSKKKNK